jgi:uncharacterized protein YjiS (DUF1127 family)
MKRRSKGNPAKARLSKSLMRKRHIAPKAASARSSERQQIADWLEKLGMSEYARRFAENGISVVALRHLSDQDLKDIGVLLGHRRIMLAAVGELAGAPAVTPKPETAKKPKPHDTAERRQITVLFSDLVGSTALSARLDPEDLREIISAYQNCVAETVRRFDGFVAKYMATACSCISAIPKLMRTMLSERCGLGLSWLVLSVRSSQTLPCRPVWALRRDWSLSAT